VLPAGTLKFQVAYKNPHLDNVVPGSDPIVFNISIAPGSTFREAKEKLFHESLCMQAVIDLKLAQFQVAYLQPLVSFDIFLKECRLPFLEEQRAVEKLRIKLGSTDLPALQNTDIAIVKHASIAYKKMVESMAVKEMKYDRRVETQRQLDQKQRVAAGALSAEDVLEGYVSSIFQKLQGKGSGKSNAEATGVDFKSMLPAVGSDVPKSVVLVDDIDEAEKNRRLHSKRQLEELKQLKHQRKLANSGGFSKNY